MNALAQSVTATFGRRARAWARRRQGTDARSTRLDRRRIYILPTRAGLIFGLVVFTMLLGSMNYNNNMGFALTFLLAGIGIISIHHCHRNLADLHLHFVGGRSGFAGEFLRFKFILENKSTFTRWQIRSNWLDQNVVSDEIEPGARMDVELRLKSQKRGLLPLPRLSLSTRYPLGLFRAWTWVYMEESEVVYPRPAAHSAMPLSGAEGRTESGRDTGGDEDISGLRNYRLGDSPRHIAWKVFARTGESMITEYENGTQQRIWIDWQDHWAQDTEQRLSELTRRVVDAESSRRIYGLRLPGTEIEPGGGDQQRHACLTALARFGESAGAPASESA